MAQSLKDIKEKRVLQKILKIKQRPIDPTNCTDGKSLHTQILQNYTKVAKEQNKQFNLGNGHIFGDPIKASEKLLEREYGDTFLFNKSQETVFIPPIATSFGKTIIDSNMKEKLDETLENFRQQGDHWFTSELEKFLKEQCQEKVHADKLTNWINRMKTKSKSISSAVEESAPSHSVMEWLFELNINEKGNHIENWLFQQLKEIPNELMKDILVLHSVDFRIDVEKK